MTSQYHVLRVVYIVLVLARVWTCTFPGYIHPDEFFQGGQELFYGCSTEVASTNLATSIHDHERHNGYQTIKRVSFLSRERTLETLVHHGESLNVMSRFLHDTLLLFQINNITATWEYQHHFAIRSIMPPLIMTAFPLHMIYLPLRNYATMFIQTMSNKSHNGSTLNVDAYTATNELSAREIWIVPRLFMTLLSILFVDYSLWYIISHYQQSKSSKDTTESTQQQGQVRSMQIMVIFASSWTTLLFVNRPFSNTLETLFLSLLMQLALRDIIKSHDYIIQHDHQKLQKTHHFLSYVIIGIVCSLGLFTRFTFAIFAIPIIFIYLHEKCRMTMQLVSWSWKDYLQQLFHVTIFITLGFAITSIGIILLDTEFYMIMEMLDTQQTKLSQHQFVVTPWNAFRYNSKSSNLSDHGIHPRFTHMVVNLPILFGPIAIFFYLAKLKSLYNQIILFSMKQTSIDDRREKTQSHHFIHIICNCMIVFSLGVLSCVPHQEPRFLLPLLVPLTILHGKDIVATHGKRKWISITFWFLFNMLLLLFFGQMHQGAVIPSLLEVPSIVSHSNVGMDPRLPPSAIITYHTYMPPTFLLRQGKANRLFVNDSDDQDCKIQNNKFDGSNVCNNIPLVDLMGADTSTLNATINSLLSCYDEDEEQKKDGYLYLIAPSVSINNLEYLKHEVQWSKLQIATEDLPSWTTGRLGGFIESLSLNIYEIKCDNRGS